mmetsp:Transcript_12216/g.32839  ORF Transcript_12216/g.32839 Transcript_12216/m.32839 type:complete len:102 (-) Transcript_12216:68-373(-)
MIPHKSSRGVAALERLTVCDGVPSAYSAQKKMVIPDALRVNRLKPHRKYCVLGRLSHEVGWKYRDLVQKMEEKRKIDGAAYHEKARAQKQILAKATAAVDA